MENYSSAYMQQISLKQDANLDEPMQNSSTSSHHDEIGEKTFAEKLQYEGIQSEFADREIEEAVLVPERESSHLSPGSLFGDMKRGRINSRNSPASSKDLEFCHLDLQNPESTPQLSISPGTREMCASQSPESTTSQQVLEDHSIYAGKEDLHSLQMSLQKSQHSNGSSGKYGTNHRKMDRSNSHSPSRPKKSSSTSKRNRNRSCSRSPHKKYYAKRSIEIDASGNHSPISKKICSSQYSEQSLKELSSSSRSRRQKHDSTRRSDLGKEVVSKDPILCANRQNPASPREVRQRSTNSPLRHALTPPKYCRLHLNHQMKDRPTSASPARQREFSYGHKKDHHNISQSRSLRSRDNHSQGADHLHQSIIIATGLLKGIIDFHLIAVVQE